MAVLTPITLIPEQTGAVTTPAKHQVQPLEVPATIFATNLAGSETVDILFSVDGGQTFEPLSQDGSDLKLTSTTNTFAIISPMLIGVTKEATISASGIFIMRGNPEVAL